MRLHPLDRAIIATCVGATAAVGFRTSKRASRSLSSHVLGGDETSWWVLGVPLAAAVAVVLDHVVDAERGRQRFLFDRDWTPTPRQAPCAAARGETLYEAPADAVDADPVDLARIDTDNGWWPQAREDWLVEVLLP